MLCHFTPVTFEFVSSMKTAFTLLNFPSIYVGLLLWPTSLQCIKGMVVVTCDQIEGRPGHSKGENTRCCGQ